MSLASIQASFVPPRQYITGYGSPLIYAPDRFAIAEVGPIDPPLIVNSTLFDGGVVYVAPLWLMEALSVFDKDEWEDNPAYLCLVNEKPKRPVVVPVDCFGPMCITVYDTMPLTFKYEDPGNPPF
jgi:hypothetical protein